MFNQLNQYPDTAFRSHTRADVADALLAGVEVWLLDGDAAGVGQDEIMIGSRDACESAAAAFYCVGDFEVLDANSAWAGHWHRL